MNNDQSLAYLAEKNFAYIHLASIIAFSIRRVVCVRRGWPCSDSIRFCSDKGLSVVYLLVCVDGLIKIVVARPKVAIASKPVACLSVCHR